jgi:electron transfer flavoprotein beta subunit
VTNSEQHQEAIVVCLKWVATRPEIDPLTGAVTADERFSGVSPADLAALEWALRIGEQRALAVTAVTVGATEARTALHEALAVGATSAVHILTEDGDEPSSPAVAYALSAVSQDAALVLCGDHSLDRGSGSVPAFLAQRLGSGQALGCVGLAVADDGIIAERRLDQGRRERLQLTGPTVISFEGGLELRRAGLAATLGATDSDVVVQPLADFPPDADAALAAPFQVLERGPYRPRPRALPAPQGSTMERVRQLTGAGEEPSTAQQLELSPADAARAVLEQLRTWGYVTDGDDAGDQPG